MTTAIVTLVSHYGKQLKLKMNACAATQLRSECKPIVAKIMAFYRASRWSDNDYFERVE